MGMLQTAEAEENDVSNKMKNQMINRKTGETNQVSGRMG